MLFLFRMIKGDSFTTEKTNYHIYIKLFNLKITKITTFCALKQLTKMNIVYIINMQMNNAFT